MDAWPLPLLLGLAAGLVVGGLAGLAWARSRVRETRRELDETRRRLEEARAARETFFDVTNHELRSPLSAILGYQELLHEGAYGPLSDKGRDAVDRLGRSAHHLLHLIDGVIELSRMRTGDVRLDLYPVDLGVVLTSAGDAFRSHAIDRDLTPDIDIPPGLPIIRTDLDRLVRALELVITSAVRHPTGRVMSLKATMDDDGVRVTVGPTDLDVDLEPDDPATSLGIRLAVAHRIAALLGGSLDLAPVDGGGRDIVFRFRPSAPPPQL